MSEGQTLNISPDVTGSREKVRAKHYRLRGPNPDLNPVAAETLQLLFKGFTYHEIAALRCRSVVTVEQTVRRLMDKTGTRNSRELIYEALAKGYLTAPVRYVD